MRSWLVVACLLFAVGVAHADDKAKAKALYEEGLRHYNVAEYKQAIDAWKQAYLIAKKPLLLFNIAQAYRLSGDCTQALTFYDSYTRDEPEPHNQDELDQAVATCKEQLKAAQPPAKPEPPPNPNPPQVKPPVEHVATAPAEPASQQAPTQWTGMRKIGVGVGAAGVVAGGLGIFFALRSRSLANENQHATVWDQAAQNRQTDGKRAATLGWVFGGGGLVLAIAGGALFYLGRPHEEHAIAIVPTSGGAAFAWGTTF